jgi:hypothetical protein
MKKYITSNPDIAKKLLVETPNLAQTVLQIMVCRLSFWFLLLFVVSLTVVSSFVQVLYGLVKPQDIQAVHMHRASEESATTQQQPTTTQTIVGASCFFYLFLQINICFFLSCSPSNNNNNPFRFQPLVLLFFFVSFLSLSLAFEAIPRSTNPSTYGSPSPFLLF